MFRNISSTHTMPSLEVVQKKGYSKKLSLRSHTELKRGCLNTREMTIDISKFAQQLFFLAKINPIFVPLLKKSFYVISW